MTAEREALNKLFSEALAWGMVYGPEIPAAQWDEMREAKAADLAARAAPPEQAAGHNITQDGPPPTSNVELRGLWRGAGGSFHGPSVETGTMPEAKLLPFLRSLMKQAAPADSTLGKIIDHFDAAIAGGLQRALADSPDGKLVDLVERHLMPAYYGAIGPSLQAAPPEQAAQPAAQAVPHKVVHFNPADGSAATALQMAAVIDLRDREKTERTDATPPAPTEQPVASHETGNVGHNAGDAARLDWLERDAMHHAFSLGAAWYTRHGYGMPYTKRASLRAAIDAARAAQDKGGKG